MPALFRRRLVWWPTAQGALLLLGAAALLALVVLRGLGVWLAASAPAVGADGQGARTLVVEGWLDEKALDAAVLAFRRGRYERVVTSGGPFEDWAEGRLFATYAERAADYLKRHGLGDVALGAAPAPATTQDRTYLSAVVVREWAAKNAPPLDAIDLFSSGVHARRSRIVYALAFGHDVEVGIIVARPSGYDEVRWWSTSAGTKAVLGEALSVAWTKCCFWPPAP